MTTREFAGIKLLPFISKYALLRIVVPYFFSRETPLRFFFIKVPILRVVFFPKIVQNVP